jgi:hypothetical protein
MISVGLGLLSLLAVIVSQLALADIYHGEADVSAEWSAVRVGFAVIVAFQASALLTLRRVIREARGLK